jgi:hypothetical protein
MLIYNTSFHITGEAMVPHFLRYMQEEYLPRMQASPLLSNLRFVRLLTHVGDDIYAYALMADTPTVVTLKEWKASAGDALDAALAARFGESVLLFSTTMRTVEM